MNDHCPWSETAQQVVENHGVSTESGLTEHEAHQRLHHYGPNQLQTTSGRSWLGILIAQFRSLLVLLLAVAATLAFVFHDWIEGIAICAVLVLNAVIGFFTEFGAVRTMESLRKYNKTWATVRRGGKIRKIEAEHLVPGDIVSLEAGDMVAADMRITECSRLEVNESSLTGESLPVTKSAAVIAADTILAERTDMLYKGTSLARGSATAVIVATGLKTEFGIISSLVMTTHDEETPLEKRLARLSRKLIVITLGITAFTLIAGLMRGRDLYLMIETSIALAVAAIPEGLPIIATLALARGMWRMARSNALINRLSAVETLGATNIICTDKTGTLTENRMVLVSVLTDAGMDNFKTDETPLAMSEQLLKIGILCSNAELAETGDTGEDNEGLDGVGDPMELALLAAGSKRDLEKKQLLLQHPRHHEEAFDSEVKMMATVHHGPESDDAFLFAVKGAAEPVLAACSRLQGREGVVPMDDGLRNHWLDQNQVLANEGFRVLAIAKKRADDPDAAPYEGLVFMGLICVMDPSRSDIPEAIKACQDAGIRVVMVTGDQAGTALHVAKNTGICQTEGKQCIALGKEIDEAQRQGRLSDMLGVTVFSRVTPQNKLDIIQMHQDEGAVVAMTGDGVNDAPALKKADIGIAMGIRGTEVARETADMVLRDDAFVSIVSAVEQGRVIFNNIRKFVVYLMSCNLSEVLVIGLASMTGAPLPLLPLQILFLNMVTDVFPALALGASKGHSDVMAQPPRSKHDAIIGKKQWRMIGFYSLLITLVVLGSFVLARLWLGMSDGQAVTICFLVIAIAQLLHVFNMAEPESKAFDNEISRNPYVWGAVALCCIILMAAMFIEPLAAVLSLEPIDQRGWLLVLIASSIPLIVGRIISINSGNSRLSICRPS
ncbi:cation-transporting P-type ATPase [Akkermansiaceae bacterium]|nr:cation-transporting P-type ATPase [Akkermansiaceae bacterium]